jgi:Zn-finger nucleic acid-binding protein
LRQVSIHELSSEVRQTCRGDWLSRADLDKICAPLRQLQLDVEEQIEPKRPRPGLYDIDHRDSQLPRLTTMERKKRWSELIEIFE